MSLPISSPRRGSFYPTSSPGPTQLSHFCRTASIVIHALSIHIRPDPVGDLQGQVLSYMHLQNLKAEVDQSLEPGRDHRQKRGTCFRLQGTRGKILWISVHSFCGAELVYKKQLETIFMKSYIGTTDRANKRVSAKDYMGTFSISTYCFLSA